MKKFYLLLLFTLSCLSAIAQRYPFHSEIITGGKNFILSLEPDKNATVRVTIKDEWERELINYPVYSFDMEFFADKFLLNFIKVGKLSDSLQKADKERWKSFARKLIKDYTTAMDDKIPVAGEFKVASKTPLVQYYRSSSTKVDTGYSDSTLFKVAKITGTIAEGYLQTLSAFIEIGREEREFILDYPAGMSSSANIIGFSEYVLYMKGQSPFRKPSTAAPVYMLKLSDVICYRPTEEVGRGDFSPKDTSLNATPGGTFLIMHKEPTNKLFEAHIFSDFKGLSETKPNGLIQAELALRFNTNTLQHRAGKVFYWFAKSYGSLQYLRPSITISKIEEHNRALPLLDLDSLRLNPGKNELGKFQNQYHRYFNALELYQYQWASAGVDANLFFINNPVQKFQLHFNAGIKFGFTSVIDSLTTVTTSTITKTKFTKELTVNTFEFTPEIRMKYSITESVSFSMANKWIFLKPLNQRLLMVSADREDYESIQPKLDRWLNSSEFLLTIMANANSKLFGRVKVNWELGNIRNSFSQLQVGYSTYLFSTK